MYKSKFGRKIAQVSGNKVHAQMENGKWKMETHNKNLIKKKSPPFLPLPSSHLTAHLKPRPSPSKKPQLFR